MARYPKMKAIPGFDDYFITKSGHVWSSKFDKKRGYGQPKYHRLVTHLNPQGYPQVGLVTQSGRQKKFRLHYLVLITYVGPRPPGFECDHKNSNRLDCRLSNLIWATKSENAQRKFRRLGGALWLRGEKSPLAKLTDQQAVEIKQRRNSGERVVDLMAEFEVCRMTVYNIANSRTWKHLPKVES